MKNTISFLWLLGLLLLFACKKEKAGPNSFILYQASGDITPKLNEFRAKLGTLNTAPGAKTGRREINWDGIPDQLLDKVLPGNFFNPVGDGAALSLQRGLVYDDNAFGVSATGFALLNKEAATEFKSFSGTRVFANFNLAKWPVGFQVAGETTEAAVNAFGMVFSDVDLPNSVSLEFFNGSKSLGKFFVPAHNGTSKFSFLGVQFQQAPVTHVVVHHLGVLAGGKDVSQGGSDDLVVIDDLIYSEPVKWDR